jgi:uncharacterized protein (TIGR03435 family)
LGAQLLFRGQKLAAAALFLASSPQFAQQNKPGDELSFVASIKPSKGTEAGGFSITPGRFLARNVTARLLIAIAYEVQPFEVSGGPPWVDIHHFDVEARLDNPRADAGQERAMIKSLLADRLELLLHQDSRQTSLYALVVARNGSKVKLSADQQPGAGPTGGVDIGPGRLVGRGMRLGLVASLLGTRLDRRVVDRTNLPERYDIDLRWTPDVEEPASPGDILPQSDSSRPSIFTAIQQQLGLKLESIKGPSGLFVIDRIKEPSAN